VADERREGSSLFVGVLSIVPTRRRRWLWAAWWTAPPEASPFRKPDASSGGARSREEAHAAAERAAGQRLTEIDGRWAGAWVRVLRGEPPWPKPREGAGGEHAPRAVAVAKGSRAWAREVLGIGAEATEDDIKRAFRAKAIETHPDRGGDQAAFIDAKRALDVALAGIGRGRSRRRAR
jgi:hypothetical protein